MKFISKILFLIIIPIMSYSQETTFITNLQDSIRETSGLIYLNNKLITHNDSGCEPALYEIDSITGNVTRRILISNATNIDWEDICHDNAYIYIADIGNNSGNRTNLKVYRILISDYLTSNTVTAGSINFSYSDQTDFTATSFSTHFDAESLISYNDSLYVFTKNWDNGWTNIYSLPKTPGTYQITKLDSINAQGYVTGATYNPLSKMILLIGYAVTNPFLMEIRDFTSTNFSRGEIERIRLDSLEHSFQIEGITYINRNQYFITAEKFNNLVESALYKHITTIDFDSIYETDIIIYPNPASNMLGIKCEDLSIVEIYNIRGGLIKTSTDNWIDISELKQAIYFVIIKDSEGIIIARKKLMVK